MHTQPSTPTRSAPFTLIELLTVMTIIAILMGILFPAVHGIKETAKKNKAKSEITAFALAIRNYEATYGILPWTGAGSPVEDACSDDIVVDGAAPNMTANIDYYDEGTPTKPGVLVNILTGSNARQTIFLDPRTDGSKYMDPWDQDYYIMLDTNYDVQVEVPVNTLASKTESYTAGQILNGSIFVYSKGNPQKTQSHVFSWIE